MADKVVSLKVLVDTKTGQVNVEELNNDLKETVKQTEKAGAESQATTGKMSAGFTKVGDSIGTVNPALGGMIKGVQGTTKAALAFIATPLGMVLSAIGVVVGSLILAFRTFTPLLDKIEQGFAAVSSIVSTVRNTFVQVVTGAKTLGEGFRGLSKDMKDAKDRAIELKKAQQDLDDIMEQQTISTAKVRAEINKLNVQAKDRTKTEKERIDLLKQAEDLEKKDFINRKKIADEKLRQAQDAIRINSNLTKSEFDRLKAEGLAFKEYAEKKGGSQDELFSKLQEALLETISIEDESTVNLEKNFVKRDKLLDEQAARRDRDIEKRKADIEAQKLEHAAQIQRVGELQTLISDMRSGQESKKPQFFNDAEFVKAEHQVKQIENTLSTLVIPIQRSLADKMMDFGTRLEHQLPMVSSGLGALADLYGSFESDNEARNKRMFEMQKKLNIGQAIIDTYLGASQAFTQTTGGVVIKSIAAGIATISGLARVNAIKNTKYGDTAAKQVSPSSGGSVSQGGQSGNRADATFTPIAPQSFRRTRKGDTVKVVVVESDIREVTDRINGITAKAVVQ